MKAIEFIENLKNNSKADDLSDMPANEYFETEAGKKIIYYLAEKVRVVNEKAFELMDFYVTWDLAQNPFYKGRNFFSDMKELGFTCKCTDCHQDKSTIRIYLFTAK